MVQEKGTGAWLELCCPRVHKMGGQEEERKQQHKTVFRRSQNTTKFKSVPKTI